MRRNVTRTCALIVMAVFTIATYRTLNNWYALPVFAGLAVVTVCWRLDERDHRADERMRCELERHEEAA